MDPIKTERESLRDLKAILAETKAYNIKFLVMGGWAVTAYVRRHRYTKDIDLVTSKALEGPIQGILKRLGYDVSNRTFGLAAEKQKGSIDLKVHISIGRILDESRTGKALAYPIPEEAYEQAPLLRITSYHPECRPYEFQVPILPLEDLFIAKVLPLGRENDVLDVASLVINRGEASTCS
ncbi:MAG: nucleotidyl transferase AbiEii/AbiGii toxin family protein [Chloroflexota bacterium]